MSKTQKIILYIGIVLLGASLILFAVNTILVKRNSAEDGPVTPQTNLFSLFERPFSINQNNTTNTTKENTDQTTNEFVETSVVGAQGVLQLVSSRPVINIEPIEKEVTELSFTPNTSRPESKIKKQGVRYIGPDGIIYEKYEDETEKTLTNTISQRLGEAFLYKNFVVFRYSREDMQTVETFLGSFSIKNDGPSGVTGSYLSKNIRSFAINSTTGSYASILADESRTSAQIIVGSLTKSQSRVVSKTNFTDWLVDWLDENNLTLTTRPSSQVVGYLYTLNTQTGLLKKIVSGYGLTTKSLPFSSGVLVSYIDGADYKTEIFTSNKLAYLPFKTIADKCTSISKTVIVCAVPTNASYPSLDDWYKGEFNFNDSIISYNTQNGSQKVLYGSASGQIIDVDIINPSTNGSYVLFRNKINGLLYKVRVN